MEIVRSTEPENAELGKRIDFVAMAPGVFYVPKADCTFIYRKSNDMWFMERTKLIRVSTDES